MQPYWQKVFDDDKTSFLFLVIFFVVAMLDKYLISSAFDFWLLAPLTNLGFLFMAGYLLAKERRWRDQGQRSVSAKRSRSTSAKLPWPAIIAFSTAVWLAGFFTGNALIFNLRSLLSWQLVFVGALVFGYYNPEINHWWRHLGTRRRRLLVLGLGVAYVLACAVRGQLIAAGDHAVAISWLFDSVRLGPGLLLVFGAWLPLLYHLVHHLEYRLQHRWWL